MPASGPPVRGRCNASFDEDPAGYDARRDCWLNRRRRTVVLGHLADRPQRAVLEIGAGTGALLAHLAAARSDLTFVGVEPLPSYVEFARRRVVAAGLTNVTFHVGTAERLPTPVAGQVFTCVLSNDTLHHLHDEAAAARALGAVAAPRASWLAIEPNRLNPYVRTYHRCTPGERNFSPARFLAAAAVAGWTLRSRRYLFAVPTAVRSVPGWVARAELMLERVPVLAGGVAIELGRVG